MIEEIVVVRNKESAPENTAGLFHWISCVPVKESSCHWVPSQEASGVFFKTNMMCSLFFDSVTILACCVLHKLKTMQFLTQQPPQTALEEILPGQDQCDSNWNGCSLSQGWLQLSQGAEIEVACPYNHTDMIMQCPGQGGGLDLWAAQRGVTPFFFRQMKSIETMDCLPLGWQRMALVLLSFSLSMFTDIHAFNCAQPLSRFWTVILANAWLDWKLYAVQSCQWTTVGTLYLPTILPGRTVWR